MQAQAAAEASATPCDIVSALTASAESLERTWAVAESHIRQAPCDDTSCAPPPPPIESLLQRLEAYWYAKDCSVACDNCRIEDALRSYLGDEAAGRLTREP